MNDDMNAKEDTPTYDDVDADVIAELAKSMVADGIVMSNGKTSVWVSIITVKMWNTDEDGDGVGHSGVVFGGVYSTAERAQAATRGIATGLASMNKDTFAEMNFDNMVIEAYLDVIPKDDFRPTLAESITEQIDPEEL